MSLAERVLGAETTGDDGRRHELVDLAFDAMFIRSFRDRVITYWNDGAEHLYGWTRAEALGRHPAELLESRYPMPLDEIERHLEQHGRWEGEITQRCKSGRTVTVRARWGLETDAAGRPQAILEINSDVSRERRAIDDLSWSEKRFGLLVSAVVDYAIFMLSPDGRIVSWNEGAQRIKGYTQDEIIGKHFSIFYPPEDVANGKPGRILKHAIEHGSSQDEGWRLRKDGTRFWASVVVTALKDDNGALRGFAKVTRDITERRDAEERRNAERDREAAQLRAQADQLSELERMKTEFLNLASHELRGPVAVVRGYNWMMRDGLIGTEELPRVAKIVEAQLVQINLLVEQMLEAARLEADRMGLNKSTFDLRDVVSDQVQSFRSVFDSHTIEIVQPEQPVLVTADRIRITSVVANLIDNAIKYSPDADQIHLRVGQDQGDAFVAVRDFGVGIAPEHRGLLFQRFRRLPTEQNVTIRGTGLGLFLCQEIARRHAGSIAVESNPGEGSEFTLKLPAAAAEAAQA
ncbi:MAG TPA: PAS domain S-box protein [Candidatus Udaeobacter sp.]|nr:PAS domain S-box protein [Candidatus Udaeobacter sp.]